MNENVSDRILSIGYSLVGRVEKEKIDFALGYIRYDEDVVAFETLIDYIGDYCEFITRTEYEEIVSIYGMLSKEMDERRKRWLQEMIKE